MQRKRSFMMACCNSRPAQGANRRPEGTPVGSSCKWRAAGPSFSLYDAGMKLAVSGRADESHARSPTSCQSEARLLRREPAPSAVEGNPYSAEVLHVGLNHILSFRGASCRGRTTSCHSEALLAEESLQRRGRSCRLRPPKHGCPTSARFWQT